MLQHTFVHPLESRRLLGASFASVSSHGTLSVAGTNQDDRIVVQLSGSHILVIRNGQAQTFSKNAVSRIWMNGFEGNDALTNATDLPSTLVGSTGDDSLKGGAGDDHLDGGDGLNALDGGGGRDVIDYSTESPGYFEFGLDGGYNKLDVDRPDGGHDLIAPEPNLTVLGTPGDDDFIGSISTNLTVDMGGGADVYGALNRGLGNGELAQITVLGGAGNDYISISEDGAPTSVNAGSGDDTIDKTSSYPWPVDGGSGYDKYDVDVIDSIYETIPPGVEEMSAFAVHGGDVVIHGDSRNNKIFVEATKNVSLYGGGGNDTLTAASDIGNVLISGDNGNDRIGGSSTSGGTVVLSGGRGKDTLTGGGGQSTLYGGDGNDSLTGGDGNDVLWGGAGNDTLVGGPGPDSLFGQSGNDVLFARDSERDFLDGGSGFDKAQRDDSSIVKDQVLHIELFI